MTVIDAKDRFLDLSGGRLVTDEYYDINNVVGGRLELYKQVMDIKEKALANVKYQGLPGSE